MIHLKRLGMGFLFFTIVALGSGVVVLPVYLAKHLHNENYGYLYLLLMLPLAYHIGKGSETK
jgi:hypothetical protein